MKVLENVGLHRLWDQLRSSYWFVPSLLVVLAIALAVALIATDRHYRFTPDSAPWWLFLGEAGSARAILSTIATAMITVVSLTFSITMVVLTLASSQFGPRLLYNFMRDRANQFALGIFLACFVFCLLVLRSVQSDSAGGFVPHLSTTTGMAFAVLSVAVLIHFIHHIADGIQANAVIANVRGELEAIVCRVLPQRREPGAVEREDSEWHRLTALIDRDGAAIASPGEGVFQAVDHDTLVGWAHEHDRLLRLRHRPGEFVISGNPLLDVFPADPLPQEALARVHQAFRFGRRRTLVQDVEFAFQQLVEVALRALSPGINDPFTAMACIDELGAGLALVARRAAQPRVLRDADGAPRVLLKRVDFAGLADIAFNQIRQNGAAHPAVMLRLLEMIAAVAERLGADEHRAELRRHARAIHGAAMAVASEPGDRADLDARLTRAEQRLGAPGGGRPA